MLIADNFSQINLPCIGLATLLGSALRATVDAMLAEVAMEEVLVDDQHPHQMATLA